MLGNAIATLKDNFPMNAVFVSAKETLQVILQLHHFQYTFCLPQSPSSK